MTPKKKAVLRRCTKSLRIFSLALFWGGMSFQLPAPAFYYLLITLAMTNYLCVSRSLAVHNLKYLGEKVVTRIKHDHLASQKQAEMHKNVDMLNQEHTLLPESFPNAGEKSTL